MTQEFMDRFKFNTKAILDRFYLMKLEKKSIEYFREYTIRWRADAVKVQPLMIETEMTSLFVLSKGCNILLKDDKCSRTKVI